MKSLRRYLSVYALLLAGLAGPAWGYDSEVHQQLTFIAARQFNQCMQNAQIDRLSALDTRYIVKANAAHAERNVFSRMFNWSYYNRANQRNRTAFGLIDTRFHSRYESLTEKVARDDRRDDGLKDLGRILNHLQDVTSPAHVVPVYTARWWRWSWSDRFDHYPVQADRVKAAVSGYCDVLRQPANSYQQILVNVADDTIAAVQRPIVGFPTTWEAFWRFGKKAHDFGDYGPAGNQFGDRTSFRCGPKPAEKGAERERCLLLKDDPLYKDFAFDRHVMAVVGSMQAMLLLQQRRTAPKGIVVETATPAPVTEPVPDAG